MNAPIVCDVCQQSNATDKAQVGDDVIYVCSGATCVLVVSRSQRAWERRNQSEADAALDAYDAAEDAGIADARERGTL